MSDCRDIVSISRAGILALEFCRRQTHAEVVAVFERSLYLRDGDAFVCIGEPGIGNGPLTLIADIARDRRLLELRLNPGQPASIGEHRIAIGGVVFFTLDRCERWRPPRWPLAQDDLGEVARAVALVMERHAPAEGFGRLSCPQRMQATPLARLARPRIARFESWLRDVLEDQSTTTSPESVHHLIGLGPGLTPSGDDFLIGALALLDALGERKIHAALAQTVAAAPHGLTSPLSGCLLRAAAAGHVGEHLHRAVAAVISGNGEEAVTAIRNIGHSSGWDMLAGIATALRVVVAARR